MDGDGSEIGYGVQSNILCSALVTRYIWNITKYLSTAMLRERQDSITFREERTFWVKITSHVSVCVRV